MKRDWTSQTGILLAGGILILVNLIGLEFFLRADLTDEKVFSLSNFSKEVVRNLEDPVTITAFFTSDLPAQLALNERFLKDKLEDYRAYGGDNVQYRFVDPDEDEEIQSEAVRYGIQPIQVQVVEENSVQLKNAYMGVAIQYESKREVIPFLQEISRLEYDLTSAILRMTRESRPSVSFLSGNGEPNPMEDMQSFYEGLAKNYDVTTVEASALSSPEKPEILLVVAPEDTIPQEDLEAIDTFLMEGGRAAFLINRVQADLQMGQAAEQNIGIETLIDPYGGGLTPNLIMDESSGVVTLPTRMGGFTIQQQIRYPLFPQVANFNPENMMVNRLPGLMFFFVSSIDTTIAPPPGVTREPLIYSSAQSGEQRGFFMLQPTQTTASLSGGPYVLGVALTGTFPSAFNPSRKSAPTRMVVVGDGDLFNESILGGSAAPHTLFGLNMVDWLIQDEALLTIRAKTLSARPLRETPDQAKTWVKYGNMALPLILVMVIGLVRWQRRKSRNIVVV